MHVKDPLPLAGFCVSLCSLHVLIRDVDIIQTNKQINTVTVCCFRLQCPESASQDVLTCLYVTPPWTLIPHQAVVSTCYFPITHFDFKLYLFYNNNTRLQMVTRWSCWVENKYETFSVRENHWNFFPGWKILSYSCRLWDSNPRPPSNSVVVITPRLAHRPNHSATEL